ncbi:hypothetical protein ACHAXH_000581 [Discostella pseudostelligera]
MTMHLQMERYGRLSSAYGMAELED